MSRIENWSAKRAGDSMTIQGADADTDAPIKIAGIREIKTVDGRVTAVGKDGKSHVLMN